METRENLTSNEVQEYAVAVCDTGMDAVLAYKDFAFYKKLSADEKSELAEK